MADDLKIHLKGRIKWLEEIIERNKENISSHLGRITFLTEEIDRIEKQIEEIKVIINE